MKENQGEMKRQRNEEIEMTENQEKIKRNPRKKIATRTTRDTANSKRNRQKDSQRKDGEAKKKTRRPSQRQMTACGATETMLD